MCDEIRLVRHDGDTPWGFRLTGGRDFGTPLLVVKVIGGSIAALAGVHVGDIVRGINYVPTNEFTHLDAQRAILESNDTLVLNLIRGDEEPEEIEKKVENLELSFVVKLNRSGRISAVEEISTPCTTPLPPTSPAPQRGSKSRSGSGDRNAAWSMSSNVTQQVTQQPEAEPAKKGKITLTVMDDGPIIMKPLSSQQQVETKSSQNMTRENMSCNKEMTDEVTLHEEMMLETSLKKTTTTITERSEEEFVNEVRGGIVQRARKENRELTEDEILEMMAGEAEVLDEDKGTIGVNFQKFIPKCEFIKDSEVFKNNRKDSEDSTATSNNNCKKRSSLSSQSEGRRSKTKKVGFMGVEERANIEKQLEDIQKQLLNLQRLPLEIQNHLLAVQQSLQDIVAQRQSSPVSGIDRDEEDDDVDNEDVDKFLKETDDEFETMYKEQEGEEEENEVTIKEEEAYEEDYTESRGKTMEEDEYTENAGAEKESLIEDQEDRPQVEQSAREQPKPLPHGQEDVEICRAEGKRSFPLTPQLRPMVLPGGRKWYQPKDAFNEEFIAETIVSQSEVLVGTTIGVNFRKYIPPKFDATNSAVYRLIHELEEKSKKGVAERPEKVHDLDKYYNAPISKRHFFAATLSENQVSQFLL
ncbi:uncharacterized protein LOC111052434 isoform X4 [Nilaparvata lugens]|uniref:uncharacterized protein LOC111052434 isoform X4 n=1 Tax=Nilaparvata lugens TaxID=108931 RepID=UPI00193DE50F|nr:uncharacterized protein LOC111052434 isoform X4 [Nilaparvata lugens]